MEKVTIIIPIFNEEECLEKTIQQMDELQENSDFKVEIIYVNDGSTDKSNEILESLTQPPNNVYYHEINKGYGAALKTGIKNSSSQYICITDADGTYPNNEIPRLANILDEGYSMVVGTRTGDIVKIPLLRRFPKWILYKLANYLSGYKIPDLNSGLRIMRKEDVEQFINILPDGFSFTTTITLLMLTNDMKVHFTPISYYRRKGKSKIRPIHDTLNFLQLILRTILLFNPLKIFGSLSIILIILSILWGTFTWIVLGHLADVSTFIIFMTGIQVAVIGLFADLINRKIPNIYRQDKDK